MWGMKLVITRPEQGSREVHQRDTEGPTADRQQAQGRQRAGRREGWAGPSCEVFCCKGVEEGTGRGEKGHGPPRES